MFTPGGTTSTLQALMLARDEALERSAATPGAEPRPVRAARLRLLASEQSHFSVLTAAHILGLDDDAVVQVPVDDDGVAHVDLTQAAAEGADADRRHRMREQLELTLTGLQSVKEVEVTVAGIGSLTNKVAPR